MKVIIGICPKYGNKESLVDDLWFDELNKFKWRAHFRKGKFYMERRESFYDENGKYKRRTIQMHRVIMKTPDGLMCDHRFGNTLDNRESELRNCTNQENCQNGKLRKGTSKYKGVHLKKIKNRHVKYWNAQIQINGKRTSLGLFPATPCGELLAALTYDEAAIKNYGSFANLNFKTPNAA